MSHQHLIICLKCEHRAKKWAIPGFPVCTMDGKCITQHAEQESCPLDFYCNPPRVKDDRACIHRGQVVREVPCTTCGDQRVMIKINSCTEHGECSLSSKAGVRFCLKCPDRTAASE